MSQAGSPQPEYSHATSAFLTRHGIWHCVTYGTLLGAVRDETIIPWDHDFDMFVRPADITTLAGLVDDAGRAGLAFDPIHKAATELAIGAGEVEMFNPSRIVVSYRGQPVGDLFAPSLFCDGVLWVYDFATEVIWTPQSSFPHFFIETSSIVTIDGTTYPGVGHPEQFLDGVYGSDWRTPYRSVVDGGTARDGSTSHGDRFDPKLAAEVAVC